MIFSRIVLITAMLLASLAPSASCGTAGDESDPDVSAAADLIVLSNGRLKPLATHARETMQLILGEAQRSGTSSLATYCSLLFDMEAWAERPLIPCGEELARELFDGRTLLSPLEVAQAHSRWSAMKSEEAAELNVRFFTLWHLSVNFTCLPGLPPEPGPHVTETQAWHHPEASQPLVKEGRAWIDEGISAWNAMKDAYARGDTAAFAAAVESMKTAQRHAPGETLSEGKIALENFYYSVDLLVVGLALFILCCLLYIMNALIKAPALQRLALIALIAGIAWNCWIIGGRTAISDRLPLKNLNEVYLVVLFFVPLIGLLLQVLLRNSLYAAVAAGLTAVGFIGALNLEPDKYAIKPLVAILMSPWREIHILTIMLSYAILLVALGLHLAYLGVRIYRIFKRSPAGESASIATLEKDLNRQAYLVVAWGFLFLTAGIATGAAWAHSSWGRYWGWDSKEVWATVAWTVYAAFLHIRLFFRVPGTVMALINILGYAAILFTYFGVTYLLQEGLHAYG